MLGMPTNERLWFLKKTAAKKIWKIIQRREGGKGGEVEC